MTLPRRRPCQRPPRGAAALVTVMLLFFLISMVAAYASRNLIFEQKTSANQYRATQAFEAAEAGLEWAVAMFNGGRIDASCLPSSDVANDTFRRRYLTLDAGTGNLAPRTWNNAGVPEPLRPTCVRTDAGWACSCPADGAPVLATPSGDGPYPAFRLRFEAFDPGAGQQPGVIRVESVGCTLLDEACLGTAQGGGGEAAARVSIVLALNSALVTPPSAALTVRGQVSTGAAPLQLRNTDTASSGITVDAGGDVVLSTQRLRSHPGTPAEASIIANDASLGVLTPDQMFSSVFRLGKTSYRLQPGAVILDDCASACSARLQAAVQSNPGRVIWVDGDLRIEANVALGTPAEPVLIVSSGNINLDAASVQIAGLLYSQAADWNNGGLGTVTVQGAAIAEGNFVGSGTPAIDYDAAVLRTLRLGTGTMVRVPGSWRDF